VGFKEFLAYSASAGSGKTYALSIRYIALLFLNQKPSSILAATFTKKAANEMKQRVLKFLKQLPKDEELLNNLSIASGLSQDEILQNQPKVLNGFIKSQNFIVTLDSFFNSILRACALQIGLDSSFAIKDSAHEELENHFLFELDKTDSINNLSNLALNLQKRGASEVMELLELLYTLEPVLPNSKYSASNLKAIEESIQELRLKMLKATQSSGASKSAINIFLKSDFKEFIKQGVFKKSSLSEHKFFKKYLSKNPILEELFLELKDKIANYHIALEQTVLHYLFELYDRYKIARVAEIKHMQELDFNDILYYTYRLISNEVTKDFIYFKLDSKFKHILLDEFQDTSSLQFLILKPLIDEIFSGYGSSEFRSFFYVGDTKQSLYRFRGGVEELFEYVATKYDIKVENLDKNYRSAKNIVDFTNKSFKDIIKGYVPQIPFSKVDGYVEIIEKEELLEACKERVEFYLNSGAKLEDIAILVFANKDGVVLQEYLSRYNIASILKTSSSLKHNPKIAALVGVIEYILTNEQLFLEPFLAHIGRSNIDLSSYSISSTPFEILDSLIANYGYFGGDLNILKLLDFAKNYDTLEEFLYEFKRSNITLSKSSQNGLQIMTIHGSKGLEFKYTVVLDRLGGRAPSRDMLIFDYKSPVELDKIYYKFSQKENFLKDYEKALNNQKELALKDRLNLLYVASTRAESALSIVKKAKSSEFDILNLSEQKTGEVPKSSSKEHSEAKKLDSKISKYGAQEVSQDKEESDDIVNYESIYFGEALHLALEMADLEKKEYKNAIDAIKNRYGYILENDKIEDIKNRVTMLLNKEEFINLINSGKIYKEQPFSFNNSFYQIDLLIRGSKNIIIDYKSSKSFENKHIKQVKNYIEGLKSIEKKETTGYLVYLLRDKIEIKEVV